MELKGKALEAFEKWYEKSEHHGLSEGTTEVCHVEATIERSLSFFQARHPSMQYGVFVDFFDSVGISVCIDLHYMGEPKYEKDAGYRYEPFVNEDIMEAYETRLEARTKAIGRANEIFEARKEGVYTKLN